LKKRFKQSVAILIYRSGLDLTCPHIPSAAAGVIPKQMGWFMFRVRRHLGSRI
jgi:hypothetical protein